MRALEVAVVVIGAREVREMFQERIAIQSVVVPSPEAFAGLPRAELRTWHDRHESNWADYSRTRAGPATAAEAQQVQAAPRPIQNPSPSPYPYRLGPKPF